MPFSAALTGVPSGAAMLMPVPFELAKLTITLPVSGQRNLSAPDTAGSASGIFGAAAAGTDATCAAAGAGVVVGATGLSGCGLPLTALCTCGVTAAGATAEGVGAGAVVSTRPASGT